MGALADCITAGVPKQLLTPLLPHTVDFGDPRSRGKAPAIFDPAQNKWAGLEDWQKGDHDAALLRTADDMGGNAGLILCSPWDTWQFLGGDLDLKDTPNAVKWRNGFLTLTRQMWGQNLLVRETVPYRALLLINIPPLADPGSKKVFHLFYTDPNVAGAEAQPIGKFELLARGQQCAIAGTHQSGNQMLWFAQTTAGPGNQKYPAPPLTTERPPQFASFDDAVAAVIAVLNQMAELGFSYKLYASGTGNGPPPPLADLAAPSVDELVYLVDHAPNPSWAEREIYEHFMLSIAGARAGLREVKGALSMAGEDRIADAVANWAAKWPAPQGHKAGTFDEERAKWLSDWVKPRDNRAGWRNLKGHASTLGADSTLFEMAMESAANEFPADNSPPPGATQTMGPSAVPGQPVMTADQLALRRAVAPNLAVTSDIAVAERLVTFFTGNAVWVPALGNWMVWDGLAGWKSDDVTTAEVSIMITDRLWWYVGTYGQANPSIGQAGWGQTTHDKMLSAGKLTRVSDLLKSYLKKGIKDINRGDKMLQTPFAMYDLTTLQPVDLMLRKALHETRATYIEPTSVINDTPLFDKLVLDLCDRNIEVADWLMHYLGYCLLGDPSEAVFVVIWGAGGNGKSTLANVLQKIFGSYATSIDAKVIQESGRNLHPASLNRLRNKRLATISELDRGVAWNERTLKQITGGDEIEARDMNKNPTPFRSQAGLIIFSNDKPPFDRADPSIQRRFRLINTLTQRTEGERILDLEARILGEEAPAVLRKIMEYAQRVDQMGHLPPLPAAMKDAATETLSENDVIYGWLQAECEYGTAATKAAETPVKKLLHRCEAYIERIGRERGEFVGDKLPEKDFKDRLRREGISFENPERLKEGKRVAYVKKVTMGKGVHTEEPYAIGIRLKIDAVEAGAAE